jgi:sporulation protein YlmC with PRC-barrel domain
MHLVRDVLDKELLDSEEVPMGRVDGLIMDVGERSQPRITHIAVGGATLWGRVHPAFGRLSRRMSKWWGPKRENEVRIPWSGVKTIGRDIRLGVEAKSTGAIDWELWIAHHVIERIPGSGSEAADDGS